MAVQADMADAPDTVLAAQVARSRDVAVSTEAAPVVDQAASLATLGTAADAPPLADVPVPATVPTPVAAAAGTTHAAAVRAVPAPPMGPPAQLAAPLAMLVQRGDGAHRLTVRLDPIELGHVEIVIDRNRDGVATVTLTAARPETLLRLVRDQVQLGHMLDQAGLPAEGRMVAFQLAPAEAARPPTGPTVAAADPGSAFNFGSGLADGSGFTGSSGTDQPLDGGSRQARREHQPEPRHLDANLPNTPRAPGAGHTQSIVSRRGVDITA